MRCVCCGDQTLVVYATDPLCWPCHDWAYELARWLAIRVHQPAPDTVSEFIAHFEMPRPSWAVRMLKAWRPQTCA